MKTELVFNNQDVKLKFNKFRNIFLKRYETSFPTTAELSGFDINEWIMKGIETSCKHKQRTFNKNFDLVST